MVKYGAINSCRLAIVQHHWLLDASKVRYLSGMIPINVTSHTSSSEEIVDQV